METRGLFPTFTPVQGWHHEFEGGNVNALEGGGGGVYAVKRLKNQNVRGV